MLPGWDYEFSIISDRSKTNDEIFHHVSVYLYVCMFIESEKERWFKLEEIFMYLSCRHTYLS